jgi:flagellum-specific ATP synthase
MRHFNENSAGSCQGINLPLPYAPRSPIAQAALRIAGLKPSRLHGTVMSVSALGIGIGGLAGLLSLGDRVTIARTGLPPLLAEIIRADGVKFEASPFGPTSGLRPGLAAIAAPPGLLAPDASWAGRVLDPLGQPIDGRGPLPQGRTLRPVHASPPLATQRARLGPRLDLGVRAINCFATCRTGQRLGLFAGSGIGKSTLLGMLARQTEASIIVIALIGERGREVREFLEDELGPEGRARSIAVIATSDAAPLLRREAAYTALTIAEYFRDQGMSVLLLMDSVTRFCAALREIGLTAGEPPATRGYPPSVFAQLPQLLERAGPGPMDAAGGAGHITALFNVLVDGDDHDEPIADAVRGILDGHIVLDRAIAETGRYPAIDVLRSLSRAASSCLSRDDLLAIRRARAHLATYADMRDMVRLGAYKPGADATVDEAVRLAPAIETFLCQERNERCDIEQSLAGLRAILGPTP